MKHDWTTVEAWGKTSAVLLASTGLYAVFCVFCGFVLPVNLSLTAGALIGIPLWVAAACYAVLAQTHIRAWLVLGALTLIFASGAFIALRLL